MNIVMILGEVTTTPMDYGGVVGFTIKNVRDWKDRYGKQYFKEIFIPINAFDSVGEAVANNLEIGEKAIFIGRLERNKRGMIVILEKFHKV